MQAPKRGFSDRYKKGPAANRAITGKMPATSISIFLCRLRILEGEAMWTVYDNKGQRNMPEDELRQKWTTGEIHKDALFRKEGYSEWKNAYEINLPPQKKPIPIKQVVNKENKPSKFDKELGKIGNYAMILQVVFMPMAGLRFGAIGLFVGVLLGIVCAVSGFKSLLKNG